MRYHFLSSLQCVGVGISFFAVFALCGSWDLVFCRLCPVWELGYHFCCIFTLRELGYFFCRLCTVRELGYQFLSSLHCVEGGIDDL